MMPPKILMAMHKGKGRAKENKKPKTKTFIPSTLLAGKASKK